jgi:hypothetical protein
MLGASFERSCVLTLPFFKRPLHHPITRPRKSSFSTRRLGVGVGVQLC